VRLPAATAVAPLIEPEPPVLLVGDGPLGKVLVVEDNADIREMLRALLELDGYQVRTANDGLDGLAAIERDPPDAALIDIGLPELDGYEVARRVRAGVKDGELFLVALTGYGQATDREAALAAGFDEHLVKPLKASELTRLLARRLQKR
jgi:two-component system CheB/CheR fusion protein